VKFGDWCQNREIQHEAVHLTGLYRNEVYGLNDVNALMKLGSKLTNSALAKYQTCPKISFISRLNKNAARNVSNYLPVFLSHNLKRLH
jgi:hypothetical protein